MEINKTYKEPIRMAVYKKKKRFFRFLDAARNVKENKKRLFLKYAESEFFKELIMNASNVFY